MHLSIEVSVRDGDVSTWLAATGISWRLGRHKRA